MERLNYSKEGKANKESIKIPKQTASSRMQIDGMILSNAKSDPDVNKYTDVATQTDSLAVENPSLLVTSTLIVFQLLLVGASRFR